MSSPFVSPTAIVDADHAAVREFAETRSSAASSRSSAASSRSGAASSRSGAAPSRSGAAPSNKARAVKLYYAVRDEIRYDPYGAAVDEHDLRASATLEAGRGWCVSKSVLLAAACRALGIPARLGFADVRNHLSTARMREQMNTEVFYWHGYTAIQLDGRWVKATPAFNIELCEKFGFLPLEFDGETDSLYHPFDREGRRHMEYLNERGEFADVPLDEMKKTFAEMYPSMSFEGSDANFDRDVEAETRRPR